MVVVAGSLAAAPSACAADSFVLWLEDVGSKWVAATGVRVAINEGLIPNVPAVNTPCGPGTLDTEFANCCARLDSVSKAGQGLSGQLPGGFQPAKVSTDLSSNPQLCGDITSMSSAPAIEDTVSNSTTTRYLNVFNTNVKLHLERLAQTETWLMPVVAIWLGQGVVAYNNLEGVPPLSQAYHTCELLAHGRLRVLGPNYCSGGAGAGCICAHGGASLRVFAPFKSSQEWEGCHRDRLVLSFTDPNQQEVAMAQYSKHLVSMSKETLACGELGKPWRVMVTGLTWGMTCGLIVVCSLLYLLASNSSRCCCGGSGGASDGGFDERPRWLRVLSFAKHVLTPVAYAGVHLYDMVTDMIYLFAVADAGNVEALIKLGWIGVGLPLLLAAALVPLSCFACCSPDGRRGAWPLHVLAAAGLGLIVLSVFLGIGSSNLLRFAAEGAVSADDCRLLAKGFAAGALAVQVLVWCGAVSAKAHYHRRVSRDREDTTGARKWVLAFDCMFLMFENVPQIVVQSLLWVNGAALVSTTVYVASAVGSIVSVAWAAADCRALWWELRTISPKLPPIVG